MTSDVIDQSGELSMTMWAAPMRPGSRLPQPSPTLRMLDQSYWSKASAIRSHSRRSPASMGGIWPRRAS